MQNASEFGPAAYPRSKSNGHYPLNPRGLDDSGVACLRTISDRSVRAADERRALSRARYATQAATGAS
jgi:hypothetical protein